MYWTRFDAPTPELASLQKVAVAGGDVETIPGTSSAASMLVDGGFVYWNTIGGDTWRLPAGAAGTAATPELVGGWTDTLLAVRPKGIVHLRPEDGVLLGTGDSDASWAEPLVDLWTVQEATVAGQTLYWSQLQPGLSDPSDPQPGTYARDLP